MSIGTSKDWIQELYVKEVLLRKEPDFYMENGKKVMTEKYHLNRGYCCGSGCRYCPYTPVHEKFSTQVKENPNQ
jgi:hypothetical protein